MAMVHCCLFTFSKYISIDKQKAVKRDCIHNIENMDQVFTYIFYILTRIDVPA